MQLQIRKFLLQLREFGLGFLHAIFAEQALTGRVSAARTPLSSTVLETATSFVAGAGLSAVFRAASMRANMAARLSGMLMASSLSRAKLARAASRLNGGVLALMTDDARLPDPLAAARALPKGSVVILRARDAQRRAGAGSVIARPLVRSRGLILLIADDPLLAARIGAHGIHLPQVRARDAAHWRARFPHWFVTAAAHSLRAILNAADADAVLLSPIFATESHSGAPSLTAARARLMARQVQTPLFALGGVTAQNAALLPGFAGLAAIGALVTG